MQLHYMLSVTKRYTTKIQCNKIGKKVDLKGTYCNFASKTSFSDFSFSIIFESYVEADAKI